VFSIFTAMTGLAGRGTALGLGVGVGVGEAEVAVGLGVGLGSESLEQAASPNAIVPTVTSAVTERAADVFTTCRL
jgi:hypothetical protein